MLSGFALDTCHRVDAGWLAGKVMKGRGYGVLMDIVLGIVGGMIGRLVFGMLGLASVNVIGSINRVVCGSADSDLASPATEKSVTHFQKRAEDTDGESL